MTWSLPAMMLAMAMASAANVAPDTAHDTGEVTREQAARVLQQRYGSAARVVRTDEVDQKGRRVYVFRLLSVNGRVWIVHIDARSGAEVP